MDLMQIHNLTDWKTHLPLLRQWKETGKIRYIGITHYTDASHDLRFNTGAISGLRNQLGTMCRWPGMAVVEQVASEQTPPSPRNAKSKPATRKPAAPLQLH